MSAFFTSTQPNLKLTLLITKSNGAKLFRIKLLIHGISPIFNIYNFLILPTDCHPRTMSTEAERAKYRPGGKRTNFFLHTTHSANNERESSPNKDDDCYENYIHNVGKHSKLIQASNALMNDLLVVLKEKLGRKDLSF